MAAAECYRSLTDPPMHQANRGLVIDRWFNTGNEVMAYKNAEILPTVRDPDGSWLLLGGTFAAPADVGEHFATRIRGIFTPKLEGDHIFEIKADDYAVLWLGADENPASKRKIAFCPGATHLYGIFDSQKSAPYKLVAGKRYYIEAVALDNTRYDHLEVVMTDPEGVRHGDPAGYPLLHPVRKHHGMPITGFLTVPDDTPPDLRPDPGIWSFFRSFDIFRGMPSAKDAVAKASLLDTRQNDLRESTRLFGVILFDDLPPTTQANTANAVSLPADLRYTIRLPAGAAPTTAKIRSMVGKTWGAFTWFLYYYAGFALLQDMIDRAVIELSGAHGSGISQLPPVFVQSIPTPFYFSDPFAIVMGIVVPFCLVCSWMYSFTKMVEGLVRERELLLRDALFVLGLRPSIWWLAWFTVAAVVLSVDCVVASIWLSTGGVLPASDPVLILTLFLVFAFSTIGLAAAISLAFSRASIAASTAGLFYLAMFLPFLYFMANEDNLSTGQKYMIAMFPPSGLGISIYITAFLEQAGVGLRWQTLWLGLGTCDNFTVGHCFAALVTSMLSLLILVWYFDAVVIGQNGRRQHPLFFLQAEYWRCRSAAGDRRAAANDCGGTGVDGVSFQHATVIYRAGWSRCRGKPADGTCALSNLSCKLERGTLTTLLGHNGAGKTTAMSLLTGSVPLTSGSATMGGVDITSPAATAISVGVCPQYNTLFSRLSVREHLWLAGTLRGLSGTALTSAVVHSLDEVRLASKAGAFPQALSGGMKRKVSLMMAMIGDPAILILDEPTAGMDPDARRCTWDAILARKRSSTVLLSTHHMDEANLLSDHIMVLADGHLVCDGTPLELKHKWGGFYTLSLHLCNDSGPGDTGVVHDLEQFIAAGSVQGTSIEVNSGHALTCRLPVNQVSKFGLLLESLERATTRFGIGGMSICAPSLEDVVLNVIKRKRQQEATHGDDDIALQRSVSCDDTDDDNDDDPLLRYEGVIIDETSDDMGTRLALKDAVLLLGWKRLMSLTRETVATVLHIVIPLLVVCATMLMLRQQHPQMSEPKVLLYPSTYLDQCPSGHGSPIPIIDRAEGTTELILQSKFGALKPLTYNLSKTVQFQRPSLTPAVIRTCGTSCAPPKNGSDCCIAGNATSYFLRTMTFNDACRGGLATTVVGASSVNSFTNWFSGAGSTAARGNDMYALSGWFNSRDSHALPSFLSMANNALYRHTVQKNVKISTYNHPLKANPNRIYRSRLQQAYVDALAGVLIVSALTMWPANSLKFLIAERISGAKHLQVATGATPLSYWGSSLGVDTVGYLAVVVAAVVTMASFDLTGYSGKSLSSIFGLMVLYGWSILPAAYLMSHKVVSPSNGYLSLILISSVSALIGSLVFVAIGLIAGPGSSLLVVRHRLDAVLSAFSPSYALVAGMMAIARNAYKEEYYASKRESGEYADQQTVERPTSWGVAGPYYLALAVQGGLMMAMLLVSGHWPTWVNKLIRRIVAAPSSHGDAISEPNAHSDEDDDDVLDEARRIAGMAHTAAVVNVPDHSRPQLMVARLKHTYPTGILGTHRRWPWDRRPNPSSAIADLSFAVNAGECFGLLGVNGAGKTTLFKSLTADLIPDAGSIFIAGNDMAMAIDDCRRATGYCPQFDALSDLLTGREHLEFYGKLQGIKRSELEHRIANLLDSLGLNQYAAVQSGMYSYGNRRKLSMAISMMGSRPMLLLDEPGSGLDPQARRVLSSQVQKYTARDGKAVLLTSHAINECEMICDRLAILVNGRFVCIGTPQHIRDKFGCDSKFYAVSFLFLDSTVLS